MSEIQLAYKEIIMVATMAVCREVENLKNGRQVEPGRDPETMWGSHIEGALGEWVVAKSLGIFPAGMPTYRGVDLGRDIEVRTGTEHHFRLPIYTEDVDGRRFVWVTGQLGLYRVRGWISTEEGKRVGKWGSLKPGRAPLFAVALSDLEPMETLEL